MTLVGCSECLPDPWLAYMQNTPFSAHVANVLLQSTCCALHMSSRLYFLLFLIPDENYAYWTGSLGKECHACVLVISMTARHL